MCDPARGGGGVWYVRHEARARRSQPRPAARSEVIRPALSRDQFDACLRAAEVAGIGGVQRQALLAAVAAIIRSEARVRGWRPAARTAAHICP